MTLGAILLVVLLLLVISAMPTWSYSREWGYVPSGVLGLFLIILIALIFLDIVPFMQSRTVGPATSPINTPVVPSTPTPPTTPAPQ